MRIANFGMPLIHRGLRRLVRHDDCAGGGEHAADAVADRDLGAGDLGGSGAAHLTDTLMQCLHAVHAEMNIGKAAAIGVERQLATGTVLRSAMKAPASPRGLKPRSSKQ
jgi:hypothetical protein